MQNREDDRMSSSEPIHAADELRSELTRLSQEIAAAEAEKALYAGGLIKSQIAVRLEILRTTRALLEQRIHALDSGAPIKVVIAATQPDESRAQALENEIHAMEAQLEAARRDASQYSGGLVHSLKLSAIATQEQTLAMLRQHALTAKYGLALPAPEPETMQMPPEVTPGPPTDAPAMPVQAGANPGAVAPVLEIVKVETRVTEANSSWSRHAWRLTLKSHSDRPLRLLAKIEFLDAQGFVIEQQQERLTLSAGGTETFTGFSLITSAVAGNVQTISAKVNVT